MMNAPLPTVHALFEAQAAAAPDAVAVEFEDERLTYAELDARSNRLARHIQRCAAAGACRRVGILLERSAEAIIAVLAVLKSGAAYVPLDPTYPSERLAFMIEDAGAGTVVTCSALSDRVSADGGAVIEVDTEADEIAAWSSERVEADATADSPAYVLYTSGSTGEPKGVLGPHRVIPHLVHDTNYIDLGPADRIAQVSNTSFDAATFEIWGALLNGARLVVLPQDTVLAPHKLAEAVRERKVTTLFLTTSLFNHVAYEHPTAFATLDTVIFGGERGDPNAARAVLAAGPPRRLINVYGPTETTTYATWHLVTDVPDGATSIPIGIPVTGTTLWVLDDEQWPVPDGQPGELYIGGTGVADGYLNRPKLTAERFLADPFDARPNARLYRTGDRGLRRPDGVFEFVSRLDRQVKMRGFRIELPEIEAAIEKHPEVKAAAVLVAGTTSAERRLVAYVGTGSADLTGAELRERLDRELPPYMVPSAFVVLESLPLTPNGKVDHRALPEPDTMRAETGRAFQPPRTPEEETLARIWADVLGVDRVGTNDTFVELGGHSLLAMRVAARMRSELGVDLPLSSLFEYPTVAELARHAARGPALAASVLRREGRTRALLSFAQERLWVVDQLHPGTPLYNVAGGFRLRGPLDRAGLQRALDAVVERHEALRSRFVGSHGDVEQVVDPPRPVEVVVRELSVGEEVEDVLRAEARRPFDLSADLMIRAALVRISDKDHALLLVVHHIAVDGWSLPLLHREIAAVYEAFVHGTTPVLAPLPVQYTDFAAWQRKALDGAGVERDLVYWRSQLHTHVPPLAMPTDAPRSPVQTHRGARQTRCFGEQLGTDVRTLSQKEGVTPFMLLLTAYAALLHQYTGQTEFAVGVNAAGRERREVEDIIGFFVNLLVLRIGVAGSASFRDLLGRVRDVALGAYAHQSVPFGLVLDAVQPRRDPGIPPLAQTVFSLQRASDFELGLAGLDSEPLAVDTQTAKFDLVMDVIENDGALRGSLEYNTDLFRPTTADRLLFHYETLLRAALEDPDRSLDALGAALQDADDRQREEAAQGLAAANLRSLRSARRRSIRP